LQERLVMARTLLIDGIWAPPSRRYDALAALIEERCGPTQKYYYNSSGNVRFADLGRQLADEIRRLDEEVNVVGFSMGGLIIRAAHLVDPTLPLRRAAFLNSPHSGSWLSWLLPLRGIRQMRPGSEFMRQLRDAPWDIPTLVTWCPLDLMVFPGTSARWDKAQETICCRVPAHIWPIRSRSIHRRVARFLAADDVQSAGPDAGGAASGAGAATGQAESRHGLA
jgi:triacylglycerol lipase